MKTKEMLKKISVSSFASIFLIILLLISISYYFYPKYDMYYMIFGQAVGLIFFTLMIFFILSFLILIVKRFKIKLLDDKKLKP